MKTLCFTRIINGQYTNIRDIFVNIYVSIYENFFLRVWLQQTYLRDHDDL